MVSELENDIIETMGDWFFRQPIRGLINIETDVTCPECLHRNRTVKYNINGDMLRSARFTIDFNGIKENLGYWGENCGQITPYFTYDDAVKARDKMMKKERL